MTYSEKIKDPRWQRKRLEIFARDDFTCRNCKDTTSPLTVHHLCYFPKTDPWEYDGDFLVTLCENCHENGYTDRVSSEGATDKLFLSDRLLFKALLHIRKNDYEKMIYESGGFDREVSLRLDCILTLLENEQ